MNILDGRILLTYKKILSIGTDRSDDGAISEIVFLILNFVELD